MSDSAKKYPKAVKAIYIAGTSGEEGREIEVDSPDTDGSKTLSSLYRGWDRETRAMTMAASEFFKTYLDYHDASNAETKNGAVKHLAKNTVKAHKAAYNVLKKHSKVFDYDPNVIHDRIVEQLEDLEDEIEKAKE